MVERTCVGCRNRAPKASLIRIVRAPAGGVSVDPGGSAPGRGCYVHAEEGCLALADASPWVDKVDAIEASIE